MRSNLSKAAFSALRWSYLGTIARSAANFIIGIVLARLLGPKPFGEIAVATLVTGIANLWADAGFSSALIQAPTLSKIQIRYVFTMQLIIAVVIIAICDLVAGPVSVSFHDPGVKQVIWGITPIFFIQALGQTSNAILRREMDFRAIQTAQMISYVCCLLVGLPLALRHMGVWSLVIAQIAQSAIYSALQYSRARHSIVPTLHRSGSDLLRYGSKITLANTMNWGISNFDNAIVGRTFGPTQLGLYNRAFTLANAPADSVVATLQTVLFSACSRADGEVEPIRRAYFACLSAVSLIVFPAFWAMSACAPTVIIALYGEAWRPSIVLFRPLVLAISVNAVMALAGPVLGAVNKVREEIVTQAWSLLVAVIVFLVASRFTMTSFAWSVCGVYLFRFIVVSQPTLTYLGVSWREVLRTLRGPSIVAGFISVVLYVCNRVGMNAGLRPMAILVCLIAIGAGLLVCQLFLFGHLILAPQVTAFLQKGVSRMPKAVGSFLETMMERQNARMRAPSIPVS